MTEIWQNNPAANKPRELTFNKTTINATKFDEELKVLLPDVFISMDTSDAGILIRVVNTASEADIQAITDHFKVHNPAEKSDAELKRDTQATALQQLAALDVDSLEARVTAESDPLLADILAILRDVTAYFKGLT